MKRIATEDGDVPFETPLLTLGMKPMTKVALRSGPNDGLRYRFLIAPKSCLAGEPGLRKAHPT